MRLVLALVRPCRHSVLGYRTTQPDLAGRPHRRFRGIEAVARAACRRYGDDTLDSTFLAAFRAQDTARNFGARGPNDYEEVRLVGLAPIEAADPGVDAIREAFAGYASLSEGWIRGRGCLMCNTAVERGARDPATGRFATAYLDRLNRAFRHALENGRRAGDFDETADLDEMAASLTTLLIRGGGVGAGRGVTRPASRHESGGVEHPRSAPANNPAVRDRIAGAARRFLRMVPE